MGYNLILDKKRVERLELLGFEEDISPEEMIYRGGLRALRYAASLVELISETYGDLVLFDKKAERIDRLHFYPFSSPRKDEIDQKLRAGLAAVPVLLEKHRLKADIDINLDGEAILPIGDIAERDLKRLADFLSRFGSDVSAGDLAVRSIDLASGVQLWESLDTYVAIKTDRKMIVTATSNF